METYLKIFKWWRKRIRNYNIFLVANWNGRSQSCYFPESLIFWTIKLVSWCLIPQKTVNLLYCNSFPLKFAWIFFQVLDTWAYILLYGCLWKIFSLNIMPSLDFVVVSFWKYLLILYRIMPSKSAWVKEIWCYEVIWNPESAF